MLADLVGTGAEVASYAYTPLKIAGTAGLASNLFNPVQWLKNAKAVAPFATPFAAGLGLQRYAEGGGTQVQKVTEGIMEAAGAYAGAAYGFGILNGGAQTLGKWGGRLMQKPAVKAFAERIGDTLSKARQWVIDSNRQRLGQTFDYGTVNYKNQVDQELIALSDSIMDSFQTKVPDEQTILQGIRAKMNTYIGQQYRARNELFDTFLNDAKVTVDKVDNVTGVKTEVSKWVDDMTRAAMTRGGFADDSVQMVQAYWQRLDTSRPTSLREAYRLYNEANNYITKNPEANQRIRDMARAYLRDMEESISVHKPELMAQWNQARDFALNVSQNVDNEFAGRITSAATINNMVDDMLKGGDPTKYREQMSSLLRAFPEQQDKDILSQVFFNSILDKAKISSSPELRAKVVDDAIKWVEGFGPQSILSQGHLEQLQQVSRILNTDFNQAILNAQRLGFEGGEEFIPQMEKAIDDMVKYNFLSKISSRTSNFRNYSMLGNEISNIKSVEELNSILSLIDDDQELMNVVGQEIIRGIATRNSNPVITAAGRVDETALKNQMSGILKDLNQIGGVNKDRIFKQLFGGSKVKIQGVEEPIPLDEFIIEMQKSLDTLGSMENLSGENLLKAAHLITGLAYGFTGRTVPATYHLSQLAKINRNTRIPAEEMSNLIGNLQDEGYLILNSKKVKAGNYLRQLGDKLKQASEETPIPTAVGGITLDELIKNVSEMVGRVITPKELEPILFGE